MNISKTIFSTMMLVATIIVGVGTANAEALHVPRSQEDRLIVYTQKTPYAHPIDYWWHLDPSTSGSWDYFAPVQNVDQPLPLQRGTGTTFGTPSPSVRNKVKKDFSDTVVYVNPAVVKTAPVYRQVRY